MAKLSRREFLKIFDSVIAVLGLSAVAGPLVAYLWPSNLVETPAEPVPVGHEDELPLGDSKTVSFGRYPALIIHTDQGIKAYSAVCTHFACICFWSKEENRIACPCHEGYFDPYTGDVISGPPPEPLMKLEITTGDDGQLYVGVGEEE
jgi:nitrite reductase/ring-hydroxylating ferredoxin subunit